MRIITDYTEAVNICKTFTGHLVARANKDLLGVYRPYCLLNDDLTPLFGWDAKLCARLYVGGYLAKNGGVLVAQVPKSCSESCGPGDYWESGKCGKMGCFRP